MRVIPPIPIDETRLVDSSVMEPDTGESAYSGGTTYALGDQVISITTHRTYQSLLDSNLANPLPVYPETSTTYWLDVGPTNKWRMFDLLRNTKTVAESPLTVVLQPGQRIDSIGLVGLVATQAVITMTSGGDVIYTRTINLNTRVVTGWLSWFTTPFTNTPAVAYFDLPVRTDAVITIELSGSGDVECAGVIIGRNVYLGATQYSAVSDSTNLSIVTRNPISLEASMVKKRSIPVTKQEVWADKGLVNSIRTARDALNAEPALWLWIDDVDHPYFDAGLIVGFYRTFTINVAYPDKAILSLELEEV